MESGKARAPQGRGGKKGVKGSGGEFLKGFARASSPSLKHGLEASAIDVEREAEGKGERSVRLDHPLAVMFGIAGQALVFCVDPPVHHFERDLAQQDLAAFGEREDLRDA